MGGGDCNTGMNQEGEGCWEGLEEGGGGVSVTAINGLIMYLAVLASCEKGEEGEERERVEEKGLTVCHGWLKASWKKRERPCLLG